MKLVVGQWIVDSSQNQITHIETQEVIQLEPRAMGVLHYFVKKPDQIISRDELIAQVWEGRVVSDHAVYRIINQIRKALDANNKNAYITTLSKKGYKLVQSVSELAEEVIKNESETLSLNTNSSVALAPTAKKELSEPVKYTIFFGFTAVIIYALWYFVLAGKWDYYSTPIYSKIKPLTSNSSFENYPSFSRDEKYIVYSSKQNQSAGYNLILKNLETKEIKKVTDSKGNDINATISNDGELIVFVRQLDNDCNVYSVHYLAETNKFQEKSLFTCVDNEFIDLEISNAGDILYYTYEDKLNKTSKIYSYLLRTGKRKQLTNYLVDTAIGDRAISLSFDNKFLGFLRNDNWEKTLVCELNLESGKESVLTERNEWLISFSWADTENNKIMLQNSSKKISLFSKLHNFHKDVVSSLTILRRAQHSQNVKNLAVVEEERQYGIWRAVNPLQTLDNSNVRTIDKLQFSDNIDFLPTFSNQTDQFAFVSFRSGSQQIWLRSAEGEVKQLTSFNDGRLIHHLAWSPDDTYIAAYTFKFEDIYIIDTKTGEKKIILNDDSYSNAGLPTWSKNGEHIYFSSNKDDDYDIYQISIETLEIGKFTDFGAGYLLEVSENERYYIKANEKGLWKIADNSESELIIRNIDFNNYKTINFSDNFIYYFNQSENEIFAYNKKNGSSSSVELPLLLKLENDFSLNAKGTQFIISDVFKDKSKIFLLSP